MNLRIEEIKLEVKNSLKKHYFPSLESQIDEEVKKMRLIGQEIEMFFDDPKAELIDHKKIAAYKARLHATIDAYWTNPDKKENGFMQSKRISPRLNS